MDDLPLSEATKPKEIPAETRAPKVEPLLLNLDQAAALLNLPPSTLRTWAWERRVPCVKLGRRRLFRREDLERWISQHYCPVRPSRVDTLEPLAYRMGVGRPVGKGG